MSGSDYGKIQRSPFSEYISASFTVKQIQAEFDKQLLSSPLAVGAGFVQLTSTATGQGGHRYWFVCPHCNRRTENIFVVDDFPLCRTCANVPYASSRFKGMTELDAIKKAL